MIKCKELNTSFKTKAEMFSALKAHKSEILAAKKMAVKYTDPMGLSVIKKEAVKDMDAPADLGYGDFVYPVINTTNYIDSHKDLHLPGMWEKSKKEQQGKTYLIINHDLSVGKVISQPKNVEIMIEDLKWSDLGSNLDGNTQALIFKSKLTERSNKDGFLAYKAGDPVQHSIRMMYVKLEMAIDSNDSDFKEEKANWEKYYPMAANKEVADEDGYFFAVLEAKIFKEGSMVLAGSNDQTPTLYNFEAGKTTSRNTEPSKDTQLLPALNELIEKTK